EGPTAPETRMIKFPGEEKRRTHTMDRLSWWRLDDLKNVFSVDDVVKLAYEDSQRTKRPFEKMFPSIIEFIFSEKTKCNR
ncbi:hypothetical protein JYU10_00920, partial [bacterium AH-315-J04]|nr:hypothetical protein [bacterium AH-315-J04]